MINVIPSGKALCADVEGVDLSEPMDGNTLKLIIDAWSQHLVLRFRDQKLSDQALERFSARLGKLDAAPMYTAGTRVDVDSDFVTVISNVKIDGKPIGDLGDGESLWHTDMSYNEVPPMASALYALEIPATGGNTGFSNMYLAYETLPDRLKHRIASMQCKHDASRNSTGGRRGDYPDVTNPKDAPGAVHPIVRTHPTTGRNALFLGRRLNAYVMGLSLEDSEALLDDLWDHATKPELTWHQEWKVGDLVLWDNRCVMHRRDAFNGGERRIMHRTQIAGDKPVYVP
ncbi:TauD/TfdA dioxygenase family protein [Candidimonas nitroreducens]|uniref:Taurine catabolism dioxygenase TauD n=1 Tax=Candidimonas nitroreducens TaxID=683354 RepID=A0A225MH26_9BURK|nr:TauD/TfdA family dioxygenase [Candidimonas nitroreducens]OWT59240.1 taurine catabolism dioxygenase TauD [Candidimonas nitroreducens]